MHIDVTPVTLFHGALKRRSDLLPGARGGLDAEVGSVPAAIKIRRVGPDPLQCACACQVGGYEQLEPSLKQLGDRDSAIRSGHLTKTPTHPVQAFRPRGLQISDQFADRSAYNRPDPRI